MNYKKYVFGDLSFKRFLKSFLFIYFCISMFGCFIADNLIFQPHKSSYGKDNLIVEKIPREDASDLNIIYLENPKSKYTILFSHGNAEDLGDIYPFLLEYNSKGYSVIGYGYQGYGQTEGISSEKNCYRDINDVFNYLTEIMKIPEKQIILHGRSVGGGPTVELSSKKKVAGTIIESTFMSAFRVITYYPILPFDRFNNIGKINKITSPIMFIHGKEDKVIPFYHSLNLKDEFNGKSSNYWIENAGHNNILSLARNKYWEKIAEFVELIDSLNKELKVLK